MIKNPLTDDQMSSVAFIDQAASWSKELTRMKARGPGDIENAMRSIEREYGVDYWTLWVLRYRKAKVKDIGISIYAKIQAAYQAECERQARRYDHERRIASVLSGVGQVGFVVDDKKETQSVQPTIQEEGSLDVGRIRRGSSG